MEETKSFKLKWLAKKQIGGNLRKLTKKDKEMLQVPNYFIWKEVNINEFNKEDQDFIKYWYKKLRMKKFF